MKCLTEQRKQATKVPRNNLSITGYLAITQQRKRKRAAKAHVFRQREISSTHVGAERILVPRAYDPSGLRQESRALGATISGMRHRCRLHENSVISFVNSIWLLPGPLDSCRRPEGS